MKKIICTALITFLLAGCNRSSDTSLPENNQAVAPDPVEQPAPPVDEANPEPAGLRQLSALLQKAAVPGTKMEQEEIEQIETLAAALLPDADAIGADNVWKITYFDAADWDDMLQVDLKKAGDTSGNRYLWCHILYKPDEQDVYGSEAFGDYRGMGAKDAHYFIKVGNVEIRAVASSDEHKNDEAIKGMLNAFKLKDIETL